MYICVQYENGKKNVQVIVTCVFFIPKRSPRNPIQRLPQQ
jgi:hypothetical protein